jgi:hypothetical protein
MFVLILKFGEKFNVAGPTCQWPTMTYGRVSQPACVHASPHATARPTLPVTARHLPPPGHMRFPAFLSPRSVASSRQKSLLLPLHPVSAQFSTRAAPRCLASPPTGAASPHLKPSRQSLVRQGSPPIQSRHREGAVVPCEGAATLSHRCIR